MHDIAVTPHDVWRTWNLQPFLILGLAVAGLAYWRGVDALWRPGGTVRTVARGVPPWRVAAFGGGLTRREGGAIVALYVAFAVVVATAG